MIWACGLPTLYCHWGVWLSSANHLGQHPTALDDMHGMTVRPPMDVGGAAGGGRPTRDFYGVVPPWAGGPAINIC